MNDRFSIDREEEEFLPDTSVIINGILRELILNGEIKENSTMIFHEAVLAELEHQANINRDTGMIGLTELNKVRNLCEKKNIYVVTDGRRPYISEVKRAGFGEIDALIRDCAGKRDATLITSDRVQFLSAKALGVKVRYVKADMTVDKSLIIEKFFDNETMSIHLKQDVTPFVKKGRPGDILFQRFSDYKLTKSEIKTMAREIIDKAKIFEDTFIEIDRSGSTIVQYQDMRIVICRPPFSDGWEITAVRPRIKLNIEDYNIPSKLYDRLEEKAEGILIAGSPGAGKTTFTRALALFYEGKQKIVKTIESPRDLNLKDDITQYSKNFGDATEIHDILLLSRPDYTMFDEVRDTTDFQLYTDLRLSGIGMVGVIHSSTAIDAIQRFVGRLELGIIPSVLDTIIFIKDGGVSQVLDIKMVVKVPTGLTESDLARPVIEVRDFFTGELVYEMYTFGEQTVVIPITEMSSSVTSEDVSKKVDRIRGLIQPLVKYPFKVKSLDSLGKRFEIQCDPDDAARIIGRSGSTIKKLEKALRVRLDINDSLSFDATIPTYLPITESQISRAGKKTFVLTFPKSFKNTEIGIYLLNNGSYEKLFSGSLSKKGRIKLARNSEIGQIIFDSFERNDPIVYWKPE